MRIEAGLKYAKTHEWVKFNEDGSALVGLSDYAQEQLGDIVFVNVNEGAAAAGEVMGDVESVKAVSDIIAPVTGTIAKINQEALDHPEKLNQDPYGTWIAKITDITAQSELLDPEAYRAGLK